jgi:hypothetical protein
VPRRIFGPKREVTGGWRKLHNEELQNFYSSPSVIRIRRVRWAGHEDRGKSYRIFVGKPEGKKPLGELHQNGSYSDRFRW